VRHGGRTRSSKRTTIGMSEEIYRALVAAAPASRERHLLSDVIGRHTDLKRRGQRELVGLCPFHQERTPSFEVNDDKGTYHCHGCGAGGDAITFLMRAEGHTFRQAVEMLSGDTFPTISEEDRAQRKAHDEAALRARITLARTIWSRSVPVKGTLGETYARARGIVIDLPPSVRFGSVPRFFNMETGEVGREHPAVVCALQNVTGAVTGVQNIYLRADGAGKYESPTGGRAKLTFGIMGGSAIRLGPATDHVIICEGPEDGWTLLQDMPDRSVWIACGTSQLSRIQFPAEVSRITIAGDNGDAGRRAAEEAAVAYVDQGFAVDEVFPNHAFKDWNDQLRGARS